MQRSHLEVERKLDAPDGVELPDLGDVIGVEDVGPAEPVRLDAVYFDTASLDLSAAGITLRRRTGGGEDGWHLKLPRGDRGRAARLETQVPLAGLAGDPQQVPQPLLDLVLVVTRGEQLVPVATISTERVRRPLRDGDGRVLAELADDHVEAHAGVGPSAGRSLAWREVEVELVDGSVELLDELEAHLVTAGLHPSDASSKLHRVLGVEPAARDRSPVRVRRGSDSGTVLVAYLREQVGRIAVQDPLVRDASAPGHGEGVHHLRVATRRLRSVLASYRPFLERERTDPLRAELAWVGGALGEVRDLQVLRTHLVAALDALPPELVLGPVRRRLVDELDGRERAARERLTAAMRGDRYFTLLDDLDRLVAEPPLHSRASRPARSRMPARVEREWVRTASRHAESTRRDLGTAQRDAALHEVRKAAKRARYAAEVLVPVSGGDARRFATAMTALQQTLGDHHDTVVARTLLLELGAAASAAGEDTFTWGVLHGREELRADAALRAFAAAWDHADKRKLHRWLS